MEKDLDDRPWLVRIALHAVDLAQALQPLKGGLSAQAIVALTQLEAEVDGFQKWLGSGAQAEPDGAPGRDIGLGESFERRQPFHPRYRSGRV